MLNRNTAMLRAFEFKLKSEIIGDYAEFGVFEGKSIINALKSYNKLSKKLNVDSNCNFFVFDSFQGLPELEKEDQLRNYQVFEQGQYTCALDMVKENIQKEIQDISSVEFIKGFYKDSLSSIEVKQKFIKKKLSVIHLDCDLYSSARDCLDFITDKYTDGALLLFDDWFCFRGRKDKGVQKAFYVWTKANAINYVEYFRYSWAGICFILHK